MAQLKTLLVNGASQFIGDIVANKIQLTTLNIPTASGAITYGSGSNNNVLRSNGTSVYWATLGAAADKAVTDRSTATALTSSGTGLVTEKTVYYGLPTINNAHNYTSSTTIYAPTGAGTANQILVSAGGTSAPTWKATANGAAYATGDNGVLTFGTLPIAQGGTGQTDISNIQAGKDGDGNTISSTYIKKSIGTAAGDIIYWSANGTPQRLAKGSDGQVLKLSGGVPTWATDNSGTGTVTSVRVQATSPVVSSVNTAQTATLNTTISLADSYGDTKNPYSSKTKNYVLAAPHNTNGVPTFRALTADDIPDLSSTYLSHTNGTLSILGFSNSSNSNNPAILTVINNIFQIATLFSLEDAVWNGPFFGMDLNTGYVYTRKLYGAVWNDYAEYRKATEKKPGYCIKEDGNGVLSLTTKRLERGCEIISDTFGFSIGQDEKNGYDTPIASSGRVLAYPYESIEEFASHIGWPVCSGPNGTVSIMTEEEEEKYPSRIIGTVSEIPDYEEWGTGKIKVDGRVWIRIK